MINRYSIEIMLLVVVIIVQQIEIQSANKRINLLFDAWKLMCEVNEKQLNSIRSILSFVKDQSESIDKFVDKIVEVSHKSDNE